MVKRPEEGLLAGQWQFPNVVVAAEKNGDTEDPGAAAREVALNGLLHELGIEHSSLENRKAVPGELEHIFSHVRHTMHIECAVLPANASCWRPNEPWTHGNQVLCWMDSSRMAEVGVTAGVKKVITGVSEKATQDIGTRKRKGTKIGETSQLKISAFLQK